jgi:hypothetical protein
LLDFDQLYDDLRFESSDDDEELGTEASDDQLKSILQKEMVQELELKDHWFNFFMKEEVPKQICILVFGKKWKR